MHDQRQSFAMLGHLKGRHLSMASGYPESSHASQHEMMRLREDNARLLRQQRDQESSLRELQTEVAQLREEDNAKRVARYAHEKASCVLRHEEQLQKLRQHYEQQLAAQALPQQTCHGDIDSLRSALVGEQNRSAEAASAREAADASAARQKRKLQKLQQQRADQLQSIRKRLRRWVSTANSRTALERSRLAFSLWHAAVVTPSQNDVRLQVQHDEMRFQSTAALDAMRAELHSVRSSRRLAAVRNAERQALLALVAPFSLWAHVTFASKRGDAALDELQGCPKIKSGAEAIAVEHASCHLLVKLRASIVESRSMASLGAPFGAWARECLHSQLRKRSRGDVVLNSGEAAKRALKQLEETRTQHEQQLTACKNEVSEYCLVATSATRAKRRANAISDRLRILWCDEREARFLQMAFKDWRAASFVERKSPVPHVDYNVMAQDHATDVSAAPCIAKHRRTVLEIDTQWAIRLKGDERYDLLHMIMKAWDGVAAASRIEEISTVKIAEASRRFATQLAEARSACSEEIEGMRREVAAAGKATGVALRGERRSTAALEVCTQAAELERILLVFWNSWRLASTILLHEKALSKSLAEASSKSEVAIACVRNESRSALQTAWGSSIDASRHKAALERRQATECKAPSQRAVLREMICERSRPASRPSTAREIEQQLELAEEESSCVVEDLASPAIPSVRIPVAFERMPAWGCQTPSHKTSLRNLLCERPREESRPCTAQKIEQHPELRHLICARPPVATRPSTAQDIERQVELAQEQSQRDAPLATGGLTPSTARSTGIDIITLGAVGDTSCSMFSVDREARRTLLTEFLQLHKGDGRSTDDALAQLVFQAWRRQIAENLREQANADRCRDVQAAREGRKGLFVAALAQQARYCMADAFAAWRRWKLEAYCERLRASAGQIPSSPATISQSPSSVASVTPWPSSPASGAAWSHANSSSRKFAEKDLAARASRQHQRASF